MLKKKLIPLFMILAMLAALCLALPAAADGNPLTLKVFLGDPVDQPAANNKIYQLIEQQFGIRFDFEINSGNLDEAVGEVVNRSDLPDLINASNDAEIVEDSGVLVDLMPYISETGTPNLYRHITKDNKLNQMLTEDGKLYIIPNYGINYNDEVTNENNGPSFFIQKKVVAWNNYEVPETLNEYFDLIERYVDANPTDSSGNPTVGFEILCEDWRHFCLLNPVQHLMGRPNDGEVIVDVTTSDYTTETFINQPYAKAYYAKLNEAYQKGLISPDTFTMTFDEYIDSLVQGNVVGMFDQGWDFGMATDVLKDEKRYEDTYLAIPLVYDPEYVGGEVIEEHYLNGSTMNLDRGFGISVDCQDPARVVQLFDGLLSDEWQTILNWGIEGVDYYIDSNGRMLMTDEQYAQRLNADWRNANKADQIFTALPKKQGTMDNGNAWDPDNQPEIYFEQALSDYDKKFLDACGKEKYGQFFNAPIQLAPYGEAWQVDLGPIDEEHTDFVALQDQWLPEIIMSAPAELDSKWNAFVAEITPSATAVTDYMQKQILDLVQANQGSLDPVTEPEHPVIPGVVKGLVLGEDGVWRYFVNGAFTPETCICEHEGSYFYVENGLVAWNYSGLVPVGETWFLVAGGIVQNAYNGLYCDPNLGWWLVRGGAIDFAYDGLWNDPNLGWWLVQNGTINFSYNGLYGDPNFGWWLVEGGAVNFSHTGMYYDSNLGWWLVGNGTVAFDYNGLWHDEVLGWWLVRGGTIDFGYNGLWNDPNMGWWLIWGGTVAGNYTGLYYDQNVGWWLVNGGQIAFDYTGLWNDPNYGWWLVGGGRLANDYNGLWNDANLGWVLVQNGTLAPEYNGLYCDPNLGWWLISNGTINFGYTGLWNDPQFGWWLIGGGTICWDYNGLWNDPNYGWWLINGGTINWGYTGGYDQFGSTWNIVNGQLVF